MKYKMELGLLICMIGIGVIYGLIFHFTIMPIFRGGLFHCTFTGILFGLFNFFIAYTFFKRYQALKETNNILNRNLEIDKLTGLSNRRAFDNDIEKFERYELYSIIFIDIDNFRDFNNLYGHHIGDRVLRNVSECIKLCVEPYGKIYRYGGEEIVVILKDIGKGIAEKFAEKIRISVSSLNNSPYPCVTVSLGISSYPADGYNALETVKASDKALLKAKAKGKNCSELYNC